MNQMNDPATGDQPWAAVLTYWCEGVYGSRSVIYQMRPEKYVREAAENLAQYSSTLVEHYAEYINCADLDVLHESFGSGAYPDDGWGCTEVLGLLERLPVIAVEEYQETHCPEIRSSRWYNELIGFLNDSFPDEDGTWISLEGSLQEFLRGFLDFEASAFKDITFLSDAQARSLGRLEVLSRLSWITTVPRERWQAFHQLVSEFNERNADIGSLG